MSVIHVGHPPKEWEGWESHIVHFHKFEILPSGKNTSVLSPKFISFGHEWRVLIFPGGDSDAKEGYISLFLHHFSKGDFSVQYHVLIKNISGGAVAERSSPSCTFEGAVDRVGEILLLGGDITNADVLNNGTLTVEVLIKPIEEDRWQYFIPKNPFVQSMLQLFLDKETADMSFKVEFRPLTGAPQGEVFHAHKLVLKTCAKGSFLASLCDDCDGETPVPLSDVAPKIFHLMLWYVYGGDISLADWKDHAKDLLEASDKYGLTNLKIEAEARYVKLLKFSAGDVVEAVAYAEKMNCILLKEEAIEFIVANANEVLASGTLTHIPESKDIIRGVICSVSTQHNKDSKDLNQLSISDLRAQLELLDLNFDGSKETLIARLKEPNVKRYLIKKDERYVEIFSDDDEDNDDGGDDDEDDDDDNDDVIVG